jgi:Ca2+-binding RTX toxin-like protein
MAIFNGTAGNETINGTSGADQIFGLGGDDTLNGLGGSDTLDGGTGMDTMTGGTGNDIYIVDDAGDVVIESSGQGTDSVRTTLASYTLGSDVEKLRFTGSGSFTGTGNDLNNEIEGVGSADTLTGGDGWDFLIGRGGDDILDGGNDGDTLDGGAGADDMEGNGGDDVYIVDNSGDTVTELSGEGVDHVYSLLNSYTLPSEVENATYNNFSGDFDVDGNGLDNVIFGGGGNDTISGLGGDDTLRGQVGADTLDGGDDDDLLVGASGADSYTGGAGADVMRIGYFESGTGAAADSITDFTPGTDLMDVSGWDANINVGGDQAFSFIGTAAFSSTAGELRYAFNGTDTVVQGDIGGDGVADFEILLSGNVTLASTDFIL